jgi:hypothetical protein
MAKQSLFRTFLTCIIKMKVLKWYYNVMDACNNILFLIVKIHSPEYIVVFMHAVEL